MRLVKLLDDYILDVDAIREVIFYPATGTVAAKTEIHFAGVQDETMFHDDEAITVWHRLSDLCEGGGDGGGHDRSCADPGQ